MVSSLRWSPNLSMISSPKVLLSRIHSAATSAPLGRPTFIEQNLCTGTLSPPTFAATSGKTNMARTDFVRLRFPRCRRHLPPAARGGGSPVQPGSRRCTGFPAARSSPVCSHPARTLHGSLPAQGCVWMTSRWQLDDGGSSSSSSSSSEVSSRGRIHRIGLVGTRLAKVALQHGTLQPA